MEPNTVRETQKLPRARQMHTTAMPSRRTSSKQRRHVNKLSGSATRRKKDAECILA